MIVLEANIDDLNPQVYGHVVARLLDCGALDATLSLRAQEGRELAEDLGGHLEGLRGLLETVKEHSAGVAKVQHERLRARLKELAADISVDEDRLAQEAAILADRADIAEEVARFGAYLERLAELLESDEPAGKRLDFTLQEALREANTMGSKSKGFELSATVIEIKTGLERMREQAANVE